jgi:hypothetical protein
MARRITSTEVLNGILALDYDDSGDETDNDSVDGQVDEEQALIDVSDEEEEEEEEDEETEARTCVGKDGTQWTIIDGVRRGRAERQNVFKGRVGLTGYSNNVETETDAYRLLIDEGLIRHIVKCTNDYAQTIEPNFNLTEEELEKFIGILYLRAVMNQRNFPLEALWSVSMGCPAFNRTLSRDRMRKIKKYIRFDVRTERRANLQQDKFALISFVLDRFIVNSQQAYRPGVSVTIDEQLFPTKARCRFTQYMPQKPDKFGIKFWVLADVDTKYCFNVSPYLGRDEQRVDGLGTHVVMKLMEPLFGKGHNVTTDNFFTNKDLAERLLRHNTTITGTIRANRRELPPPSTRLPLHTSEFFQSDQLNLVRYQATPKKTVCLLSTQHKGNRAQVDGKKKPESILYYNANKYGVDILDSMCRQMSTKAGCRRWPLAVFYNILDFAAINAWIIFKKSTNRQVARRNFLLRLSSQLRRDDDQLQSAGPVRPGRQPRPIVGPHVPRPPPLESRVNCLVRSHCTKNRTVTRCSVCVLPVCGQCTANVCTKCVRHE